MSLPESLERAASALEQDADAIRPANGDPIQLLETLDGEAAVRVLGWLLANEPDGGEELAAAWGEQEAGVAPLQAIRESELPKDGRKALRRVLHRLRSRGVEIAKPAEAPVVARLPEIDEHFEAACVSAVDPSGAILCYVVETADAGGASLFEILCSEGRGVENFEVYNAGRSRARKFIRQVREETQAGAVDADPAAVRALVAQLAARQPASRALPRAFASHRSRFGEEAAKGDTPGEQVMATLGRESNPSLLQEAAELIRKGTLGPWPPPVERAEQLALDIRERVKTGRIVLSESQERQRVGAAVEAAVQELFQPEFVESTVRRLCHAAYVFSKRSQDGNARAALAAAVAFESLPLDENPVAEAFVETALGGFLATLAEDSEEASEPSEEGGIIVES